MLLKKLKEFSIKNGWALYLGGGSAFLLDSNGLCVFNWRWWIVVLPVVLLVQLCITHERKRICHVLQSD